MIVTTATADESTRSTRSRPRPRKGLIAAVVVLSIVAAGLGGTLASIYGVLQERESALETALDDLETTELSRSELSDALELCSTARDDAVDWAGKAQDNVDQLRSSGYWGWLDNVEQTLGYASQVDECDLTAT